MELLMECNNAYVVGGCPGPSQGGDSSFLEARPVLSSEGGLLFIVHHYEAGVLPVGDRITPYKWEVVGGEYGAFKLKERIPYVPTCMFWIFRKSFSELMPDVLTAGEFRACARGPLVLPEFVEEIFLVNESVAAVLRAGWIKESFSKAWDKALAENWADAHRYADLAFVMKGGFDLAIFVLVVIATEKIYGKKRAEWEVSYARNSCGAAFIVEFQKQKERVLEALAAKNPFPAQ
ncbi:MAG: hypothetical protein A3D67_00080 [Candidatus Lloydbacteria bacterium RIFCSPHIGHO2_02_FULL_51_22]|uniref:Uncharacterized protein n=2 Tax=Candidatus Lloydiibacteriota TaxID=1817910 RepID=A0A1G2DFI1_9BACT|nr:MAG: hypothetical protein A3D67_00080 [Candidatus Lloydbacteria bacterium RIFCSPHIGHO2_02_FULL_51_22]